MMKRNALAIALAAAFAAPAAASDRTPAPEGATVFFENVKDGDTLSNPVNIRFGVTNLEVVPAGTEAHGSGHHHLLINVEVDDELLASALPADEQHRHFGGGQTEVTLELPPGTHTLQLLVGDHNHVPHDPPVISDKITVTVN